MRHSTLACLGVLASLVGLAACGGGDYGSTPTTPSPSPAPAPASSATITILGNRGNQSFTPNPGSAIAGKASFRNADGVVHRLRSANGTFDSGDIAPGQTSAPLAVPAAGLDFHCSIHPGMVGTISAAN
jgi:hypothetical protein